MTKPNVTLSQGDIFNYNKGLIIIPRSTSGSINVTFEKGLHQLGVRPIQEETPLGTVSIVWNASETFKDLHIAYATSVNVNSSDFTTIATIAVSLLEQLSSSTKIVDVYCPLLGTGAGNLDPTSSFTYLILPFITKVRSYSFNVVIYDSLVYDVLKKISLERYTIVKQTIQRVFLQIKKDQSITDVVKSKDFFFQIAKERLAELLRSDLNEEQKSKLLKQHQEFKGTFQQFLDQQSDPVIAKFLSAVGELITYFDIKAYNGGRWNQYPDKRAVARANIRQDDWVKNIIQYTIHRNTELLPRGIGNSIKYILNPEREFPIISERDRQLFLDTIGDFQRNERGFNELVRQYFEQIEGPRPVNSLNFTLLVVRLIYSPLIRLLWDPDLKKAKGSKKRTPIVEAVQQDHVIDDNQKIIRNGLHRTKVDNDVSFGSVDLLDFQKDIRAFSTLIAMRDVQPPLAIVLFGKWGSGKSFFMHHLKRTVSELSNNQGFLDGHTVGDQALDESKPYCQGVVQIEFNAWSYLDSNLWAGLVSMIFDKLDDYIRENVKHDAREDVRRTLTQRLQIVASQKSVIEKEIKELNESKEKIVTKIATASKEKDALLAEVRNQTLADIRGAALRHVKPLIDKVKAKAEEAGIEIERVRELSPVALYDELKSWVTFFKLLFQLRPGQKVVLSIAFILLAWLIFDPYNYIAHNLEVTARGALILITLIGPIFTKFYLTVKKYKDLLLPVLEVKNKFIEYIEAAEFDHRTKVQSLQTQLSEKTARLEELAAELLGVEKEIGDVTYALKYSVTKKAFFDFIRKKNEDGSYEKHLGLISTVRRDFQTLSDLFTGSNESSGAPVLSKPSEFLNKFEKPLDRIVLYIDDLDRCPDDKVMDVLQAVHLLMAFPLFIVIVGVDKRCVHNALTHRNLQQYSGFSKTSDFGSLQKELGINIIKPSEYLEKIFQIPFHIPDPKARDIETMIYELLKDQVLEEGSVTDIREQGVDMLIRSDTNGDEVITLVEVKTTESKVENLKAISQLIGQSPRTIKRFINIYRIIRAHELLSYNEQAKEKSFLAITFVLAMTMGRFYTLSNLLESHCIANPNKSIDDLLTNEAGELREILKSNKILTTLLQMKGFELRDHFPFIKRFSFNTY